MNCSRLISEGIRASPTACYSPAITEAIRILERTGCGQGITIGDKPRSEEFLTVLSTGELSATRNAVAILEYSRETQAKMLDGSIQKSEDHPVTEAAAEGWATPNT